MVWYSLLGAAFIIIAALMIKPPKRKMIKVPEKDKDLDKKVDESIETLKRVYPDFHPGMYDGSDEW